MTRIRVNKGQQKQHESSIPEPNKEPAKPEETVTSHLDQIDKTINEILSSTALENVVT